VVLVLEVLVVDVEVVVVLVDVTVVLVVVGTVVDGAVVVTVLELVEVVLLVELVLVVLVDVVEVVEDVDVVELVLVLVVAMKPHTTSACDCEMKRSVVAPIRGRISTCSAVTVMVASLGLIVLDCSLMVI
jgi:hypothetical protein